MPHADPVEVKCRCGNRVYLPGADMKSESAIATVKCPNCGRRGQGTRDDGWYFDEDVPD